MQRIHHYFISITSQVYNCPMAACMTLYADDIMLYHPIHTPVDYIHFDLLQQDNDEMCTWTMNNLLKPKRLCFLYQGKELS